MYNMYNMRDACGIRTNLKKVYPKQKVYRVWINTIFDRKGFQFYDAPLGAGTMHSAELGCNCPFDARGTNGGAAN